MQDYIRKAYEEKVEAQRLKNKDKWGYQDIQRLLLVSQEQLGQMAAEFVTNGASEKFRFEVIHLGAVLPEIYNEAIQLEVDRQQRLAHGGQQ